MESKIQIRFDDAHYKKIMKKFNYEPSRFSRINFALRAVLEEDLQLRWLCHHDADKASKRMAEGRKTTVSTGIGISGVPHIGTISQIMRAAYLQKAGIDVRFVLGDLDAYNGKNKELGYVLEMTKKYSEFVKRLCLGGKEKAGVRDQNSDSGTLRTMYLIGKFMDEKMFKEAEEELHDFYVKGGKVDNDMSYRRRLSLNLMTADFIHLLIHDGYDNVIVTLGIDEHQYVLFARKTLENMKNSEFENICKEKLISGLYSPLIVGLYGYPKMSKSFPESSITVLTPDDQIADAIRNGEGSYDFPENNVVYQMMSSVGGYSSFELRQKYEDCLKRNSKWKKAKDEFVGRLLEIKNKWPG